MVPRLAESWSMSKDGLRYRFKLRRGVKIHENFGFKPTRDFNADDVVFTYERMIKADHPFNKVGRGVYPNFSALGLDKNISEVKANGPHEVVFVLREPQQNFIAYMSSIFNSVGSAEYAQFLLDKGTPEKFDFEPVGTGPFIFKTYEKDQVVRFTRNENYFLGPAGVKNLLISIVPDPSVRVQKIRVGECDVIMMPPMDELENLRANSNINVEEAPSSNTAYLVYNTSRKPFDDPRVRRALSMALNLDSYVAAVYGDRGTRAVSLLPPQMAGAPKNKAAEYNPEKAKKLLAEAGHGGGLKLTLWSLPVSRHYNPNGKRMAELMQADLKKIGVEVSIQTFDWPTYLSKLKSTNEHELAQLGWGGDTLDPDSFLAPTFSCTAANGGFGATKWCNTKFDAALRKARTAVDAKSALAGYREASSIFQEELPAFPIAHAKLVRVSQKKVKNYQLNPSGGTDFHKIRIE